VIAPRTGNHRILLVDDEPNIRRFAARVLLDEGYLVEEAEDGAEALGRLRRGGPAVHIVVSDVVMPRLNGVELLQALSTIQPKLPVILMSGYAAVQLEGMGIAAPCGMLAKPFSGERLVEEVRRCLPDADPLAVSAPNVAR
jgi:DNA-binding NtrC family response regulator